MVGIHLPRESSPPPGLFCRQIVLSATALWLRGGAQHGGEHGDGAHASHDTLYLYSSARTGVTCAAVRPPLTDMFAFVGLSARSSVHAQSRYITVDLFSLVLVVRMCAEGSKCSGRAWKFSAGACVGGA